MVGVGKLFAGKFVYMVTPLVWSLNHNHAIAQKGPFKLGGVLIKHWWGENLLHLPQCLSTYLPKKQLHSGLFSTASFEVLGENICARSLVTANLSSISALYRQPRITSAYTCDQPIIPLAWIPTEAWQPGELMNRWHEVPISAHKDVRPPHFQSTCPPLRHCWKTATELAVHQRYLHFHKITHEMDIRLYVRACLPDKLNSKTVRSFVLGLCKRKKRSELCTFSQLFKHSAWSGAFPNLARLQDVG